MEVDPQTNEVYIADGYTNLRVVVVDAETGLYKRHWGAYGQNPVNDAEPRPVHQEPARQRRSSATPSTPCASPTTGWSTWPTG